MTQIPTTQSCLTIEIANAIGLLACLTLSTNLRLDNLCPFPHIAVTAVVKNQWNIMAKIIVNSVPKLLTRPNPRPSQMVKILSTLNEQLWLNEHMTHEITVQTLAFPSRNPIIG